MIIEDMNQTFTEAQTEIVQEGLSLFGGDIKCLNVQTVSEGSKNRIFFITTKERNLY